MFREGLRLLACFGVLQHADAWRKVCCCGCAGRRLQHAVLARHRKFGRAAHSSMCGPALHAAQGQQEAPETVERVQAASDAGCGCGCGVGVGAEGGSQDPRAAAVVARRCVRRAYGRGAGVTPGVHLRL